MKTETFEVKKTVELPTGEKVERKASINVNVPENNDDLKSLNGDAWKWAAHGITLHAKVTGGNRLLGAAGDKKLKKQLKQFRETLSTFVDFMEMDRQDAVEKILSNPKMSSVKEHFNSIVAGGNEITVDFTSELPKPRWFSGGEPAEEESEDEE